MSLYDGFDYITKRRNIVWMGPTGCGKTGLATGFLLQALGRGYRGYFIPLPELIPHVLGLFDDLAELRFSSKPFPDRKDLRPAAIMPLLVPADQANLRSTDALPLELIEDVAPKSPT
jgi:hypothetical protein